MGLLVFMRGDKDFHTKVFDVAEYISPVGGITCGNLRGIASNSAICGG